VQSRHIGLFGVRKAEAMCKIAPRILTPFAPALSGSCATLKREIQYRAEAAFG
jgi:hypothetical protein